MTTLSYDDLLTIRSVLMERRADLAATLGRVEQMLDEQFCQPLTTLNAKTIAAINEPIEGREVAHSVDELLAALQING